MMRIGLYLATNLAILVLLGIIMSILGLDSRSTMGLLVMAGLFGMGGSFISLAMSKWIAKKSTGAYVIEQPRSASEQWLVDTVRRQAQAAEIGMPEVAIYDSPDINAFATGMRKDDALVAVSTGLLQNMTRDEAEAVLAHEVSHVAGGDMVTMALIQGVLNTFVIFLSRVAPGYQHVPEPGRRGRRVGLSRLHGGDDRTRDRLWTFRQHHRHVVFPEAGIPG